MFDSVIFSSLILSILGVFFLLSPVLLQKQKDLLSPLPILFLGAFIGTVLRILYIIVDDTGNAKSLLLNNLDTDILGLGAVLLLLSFFATAIGYLSVNQKHFVSKPILVRWKSNRVYFVATVLVVIAIYGTAKFIGEVGIVFATLDDASRKRFIIINGERASLGYYRWMAVLLLPACLLLLIHLYATGKSWFSIHGFFVIILGFMAMVFPFIVSSRLDVFVVLISVVIVYHYMKRRLSLKSIGLFFLFVMPLIILMTFLRPTNENISDSQISLFSVLENIAGKRHFVGVDKMALVVDSIDKGGEYKLGSTIAAILAAPIPRTMWSDKPRISPGLNFRDEIYLSQSGGGVPPSLPVELYWNFGVVGVLVGMFLFGFLLRAFYLQLKPYSPNINKLFVYAMLLTPFAFTMLNSSLSGGLIGIVLNYFVAISLLSFVSKKDYREN